MNCRQILDSLALKEPENMMQEDLQKLLYYAEPANDSQEDAGEVSKQALENTKGPASSRE